MKILFCAKCSSFHSFKHDEQKEEWTFCDCKQMAARWVDDQAGTVEVLAQYPERSFIVGLNNRFLTGTVVGKPASNQNWRELHQHATNSPNYIFDASNRACWACIIRVGETSDIKWHPLQNEALLKAEPLEQVVLREPRTTPFNILVNGVAQTTCQRALSYEDVCALAGKDISKGVLYTTTVHSKTVNRSLRPGESVPIEDNMHFYCLYTGNA